jgi:exosortase
MSTSTSARLNSRSTRLLALSLLCGIAFRAPLVALGKLSIQDGDYNYIALVPAISMGLMFLERRRIFILPRYCPAIGLPIMLSGVLTYLAGGLLPMRPESLSFQVLAVVLLWLGGFVLCYGPGTFKRAAFPLLFLLCIVPPPAFVLDNAIEALRAGSTDVSYRLFRLARVPVLRQGLSLLLPGAEIEVAPQCSGIRSSACLMIAGLLAGHVFLQSNSRKILLTLCIVPIMIFKNAVRIVTISLLGVYLDHSYFFGSFHHQYGGLAVSAMAVAILLPIIWTLRKSEQPAHLETGK